MAQEYKDPFERQAFEQNEPEETEGEDQKEPLNDAQEQAHEIPIQEENLPEDTVSFFTEEKKEEAKSSKATVAEEVAAIQAEMDNLRLRQAAEMENYKKRLAREHQDQLQYAAEKVLGDLLPTLDNLELALQYGTKSDVCKDLLQGVSMTHKLLLDCVQKHGLKPVGEVGEPFNPAIHEAVGFEQSADLEQGSVAKVLQRGYTLGSRLLRAAKVMVVQ